MNLREIRADLHIHTCLSPCAELEMVPTAIVRTARARGLDMIAICDHNSVENVAAVVAAGKRECLSVIPGIEITSREEVHILGLFGSEEQARDIQAVVYENLPGENDGDMFGIQAEVDEWDEVVGVNDKLLIGATVLKLNAVVDAIHDHGGVAIAAHIDREGFGLIGHLGFVPPDLALDALEVSHRATERSWEGYTVVTASDAHRLDEIGTSPTTFHVRTASFEEVERTLLKEGGRHAVIS